MKCCVCNNELLSENSISFVSTDYHVIICPDCGLGTTFPQPTQEEVMELYHDDYYAYSEGKKSVIKNIYLQIKLYNSGFQYNPFFNFAYNLLGRFINFHLPPLAGNNRLLEIGCGSGFNLHLAKKIGWQVYGIEPSSLAVLNAQKSGLMSVKVGFADDMHIEENYYDLILLNHSLEHTSNPANVLFKCYQSLNHDGRIIITVPKFDSRAREIFSTRWHHYDLPKHLFHFSKKSLIDILTKIGYTNITFNEQSTLTALLLNIKSLLRNIKVTDKKCFLLLSIIKSTLKKSQYSFSDVMTVSAKK